MPLVKIEHLFSYVNDKSKIINEIKNIFKKNKKIIIIVIVLLPIGCVIDVWILGTASAAVYETAIYIKKFFTDFFKQGAPQNEGYTSWYFKHPFIVSWSWLTKSSSELSLPAIRNIWLILNGIMVSAATVFQLQNRGLLLLNKRKNDAGHVHGLKVADSPADGNTRWAGEKDIAHICEFGPPHYGSGGVVLGELDNIVRIIPGKNTNKGELGVTGHVGAYGVTGSGKSYTFSRNNLIAAVMEGQSIVATDPKGELFRTKSKWLIKEGYNIYVLNLVKPAHSHRWDPILECRNDEEISEMATCMVENAAKDDNGYFVSKEIQLYEALAGLLKDSFPKKQAHPRSAISLSSWTQDKLEQVITNAYREGKISTTIYERWRGAAKANLDNAASGLTSKLKIVTTKALSALMSDHEIDLESIGKRKTALFCILPVKGSSVLKPILSVFYMFLFNRLYEVADENEGKLPVEVRFILDEFANIGRIPGFSEKISTARSIGILLQYIIQGRSQLDDVYGEKEANNIMASTPISLLLGVAPTDEVTIKLFSDTLGDAAVYKENHRKDITTPIKHLELTEKTKIIKRRKLMENYELKEMNTKYCIALVQGCKPLFMQKVGWVKMPQAKEIKSLGELSIEEYIPERSLDVELPASEIIEQDSVLWGIKTGKTNTNGTSNSTDKALTPWASVQGVNISDCKNDEETEKDPVESESNEVQGVKVSKSTW